MIARGQLHQRPPQDGIWQRFKNICGDVYNWVKANPFYTLAIIGALATLAAFTAGAALSPIFFFVAVKLGIGVGAGILFPAAGYFVGNYISNSFDPHRNNLDTVLRGFSPTLSGFIAGIGFSVGGYYLLAAVPVLSVMASAVFFMVVGAGVFAGIGAVAQKFYRGCCNYRAQNNDNVVVHPQFGRGQRLGGQQIIPYQNPHLASMVQNNANANANAEGADLKHDDDNVAAMVHREEEEVPVNEEKLYLNPHSEGHPQSYSSNGY